MGSLSKSEDNQYTSIEEIKRLKVQELKTILSDHGQPVTGKKADLVHGFLVSFSSVSRSISKYFKHYIRYFSSVYKEIMRKPHTHTGLALV